MLSLHTMTTFSMFLLYGICVCGLFIQDTEQHVVNPRQARPIIRNMSYYPSEKEPGTELRDIRLDFPGVRQLYAKLASSIMWVSKWTKGQSGSDDDVYWCDVKQEATVASCGGKELMAVWMASGTADVTRIKQKVVGDAYQHQIDSLCRNYNEYKRCIDNTQEEMDLKSCTSLTKLGVDGFYGYICQSDAIADMVSAGLCLSKYSAEEVTSHMELQEGCHESNYGGIFHVMMASFRAEGMDIQKSDAGLPQQLKSVCAFWDKFRRCQTPAVKHFCGQSAEKIYNGLLRHVRSLLESVYGQLGEKYLDLVRCEGLTADHAPDIVNYVQQQTQLWLNEYECAKNRTCTCSGLTVMHRDIYCFWQALSKMNVRKMAAATFSLNMGAYQTCSKSGLAHRFLECRVAGVGHCTVAALLNYSDIFSTMCRAITKARKNIPCTLAMTLGNKYLQQCDMSMSSFLEYMVLEYNQIYRHQVARCTDRTGASSVFPKGGCVVSAIQDIMGVPEIGNVCDAGTMHAIVAGFQMLMESLGQVDTFFGRVYDGICSGKYPECGSGRQV